MYNLEYADTLRSLVSGGADAFYSGDIAYDIVDAVVNDRNIPGDMSLDDLKNYHIIERPVVCENFRGHKVCGMGPPSSGGIGVGQVLGMLNELNKTDKDAGPLGLDNIHLFTQAMRLAFADRNQYVADSDFVEVPVQGMLNDEYLTARANLINADVDMGFVLAGNPPGSNASKSSFLTDKENGTAHISIIDQYGNAISMTTTIESPFGNSVMVRGFLLNNELTDFSFEPIDESNNKTFANRVEPNKRPRSSMAPTIVFDETGNVEIVTGSAGGSKIIGDVAQTIMNIIDFDMDPQEAANIPHYQNRNEITEIESPQSGLSHTFGLVEYDSEQVAADLKAMGHSDPALPLEDRVVSIVPMWISKLTTIQVVRDHDGSKVFVGGVDPRSDGAIGGRNEFDRSFPDTFTPLDQANVDTSKAASDTNSVSTSCLALVFVLLCFCA
jgi:gamma-glutamyltranspeptidase/glutathione hydrolase